MMNKDSVMLTSKTGCLIMFVKSKNCCSWGKNWDHSSDRFQDDKVHETGLCFTLFSCGVHLLHFAVLDVLLTS